MAALLTAEERVRRSIKVGLKNAKDQVEDQRKKLYLIEIKLAMQKQLILDLKVESEMSKAVAQTTEEATEASRLASYKQGV